MFRRCWNFRFFWDVHQQGWWGCQQSIPSTKPTQMAICSPQEMKSPTKPKEYQPRITNRLEIVSWLNRNMFPQRWSVYMEKNHDERDFFKLKSALKTVAHGDTSFIQRWDFAVQIDGAPFLQPRSFGRRCPASGCVLKCQHTKVARETRAMIQKNAMKHSH